FIDFSKQVILGNKVFYVDCFGLKFPGWVRPEHIKTFLRNCFIPNSTKKAVDPSLSTASPGTMPGSFCPVSVPGRMPPEREGGRGAHRGTAWVGTGNQPGLAFCLCFCCFWSRSRVSRSQACSLG